MENNNRQKENRSMYLYTALIFVVALLLILLAFFGQTNVSRLGNRANEMGVSTEVESSQPTSAPPTTEEFARIRIGVGEKPNREYPMADWVLGKIPEADREKIFKILECTYDAAAMLIEGKLDDAMGKFNGVKF